MPPYSPSPLLTPQPSTPPTPHRSHPSSSSHDGQVNQTTSFGSGLFSGQTPAQTPTIGWGSFGHNPSQPQSTTAASHSHPHHVAWGAVPSLLPASVQWGSNTTFGGSTHASSSSGNHDAFGSSSASTAHYQSPHPNHHLSPVQPMPDQTRKSEVKRKRFDDDEDEEMGGVGSSRTSPPADHQQVTPPASASEARVISSGRNLVPKRLRAGLGGMNALDDPASLFASPTKHNTLTLAKDAEAQQSQVPGNVDLGKLLASLDKPHLLSLVTSLLSMHPNLTPTVHGLLPLPSLESVNQSLDSYEAAIKQSLPFGLHSIRPEYAWNRVRGPLGELVSGVQGWMDFFNAKEQQQDGQGADKESVHPSTMFSLLHTITARAIKIQKDLLPPIPARSLALHRGSGVSAGSRGGETSSSADVLFKALPSGVLSPASPNVLLTTLIPLLLSAWDSLIARISHDLNVKGKMFGREVVVGWLRGIEALGSGEVQRRESNERSKSTNHGGGSGQEGEARSELAAGRQREEEEEEERTEKERVEVLQAVQAGMRAVDASFKREIGWLVGVF